MSGIDMSSGHMGVSSSTQTASTLKSVGGTAFTVLGTAGSVAAGTMGGPMAGSAVAAGMSALRSGVDGGGSDGSAIGDAASQVNASAAQQQQQLIQVQQQQQSNQTELFMLQQSVNSQSQSFNVLTNVQKSKHDAAMAAIQNTR